MAWTLSIVNFLRKSGAKMILTYRNTNGIDETLKS